MLGLVPVTQHVLVTPFELWKRFLVENVLDPSALVTDPFVLWIVSHRGEQDGVRLTRRE